MQESDTSFWEKMNIRERIELLEYLHSFFPRNKYLGGFYRQYTQQGVLSKKQIIILRSLLGSADKKHDLNCERERTRS